MQNSKCKLCLNESKLQNSHVIGDSVFRKIFQSNSGKAILLSENSEYIEYSNDSWAESLLCRECERFLNEKLEQYSLSVLRGKHVEINKTDHGITLRGVDSKKLNMYFISLLWRAANSSHTAYSDVYLENEDNEYLRKIILLNSQIPLNKISIKISRLIDHTDNGFSLDILKKLIISPFTRVGINGDKKIKVICFTFEGFFIEIFIPGLSSKYRNEKGIIYRSKNILLIPYINIINIEEIFETLVSMYGKHVEGKTKIKSTRAR